MDFSHLRNLLITFHLVLTLKELRSPPIAQVTVWATKSPLEVISNIRQKIFFFMGHFGYFGDNVFQSN